MKKQVLALTAVAMVMGTSILAENVLQKTEGETVYKNQSMLEVKEMPKASGGKIARIKGDMGQWGFVTYWFGSPAPAGKSTVRVRVYVDKDPTSTFALYTASKDGQKWLKKLELPKDTKKGDFVDIDIPVERDDAWSGLVVKKFVDCEDPSVWIDKVSIITN